MGITIEIENEIKKRLDEASSQSKEVNQQITKDLAFECGDTLGDVKKSRGDNRTTKNLPMIRRFTNRIVNPVIKHPYSVDLKAKEESYDFLVEPIQEKTSEIIESDNAREAMETGFRTAVVSGYGYFIIETDYKNSRSMDQKVCFRQVLNPNSVFFDPSSTNIDGSDANYAFTFSWQDKKAAVKEHGPEVEVEKWENSIFSNIPREDDNKVPEMIYYKKIDERVNRTFRSDGEYMDDLEEGQEYDLPEGVEFTGSREVTQTMVQIVKFIGAKMVDSSKYPLCSIPVVPIYGDPLYNDDGSVYRSGIVKLARTSQEIIDFYVSSELELASMAPRSPWLIPFGGDEGHEKDWSQVNTKLISKLYYNMYDENGQPLNAPNRLDNNPQFQSYIAGREKSENDMQAEIGLFNVNFGESLGNESGKSVFLRQDQGELSTIHYQSNFEKSLKHAAKIVTDMVIMISDNPDVVEIERNGNSVEIPVVLSDSGLNSQDFEFSIINGPAYETQRQYANAQMIELAQSSGNPAIVADILAEEIDHPRKEEIKRRLKAVIPVELREPEEANAPDPQAMQALQQAQQLTQDLENTIEQQNQLIAVLQSEIISKDQETQAKVMTEQMKSETTLAKAEMDNQTKLQAEQIKAQNSTQKSLIDAEVQSQDREAENMRTLAEISNDADKENAKIVADMQKSNEDRQAEITKTMINASNTGEMPVRNTVNAP